MTVRPPTTNVSGNDGRCGFRDVDFKTAQDLVVALPKVGRRYRIKSISIISKTVASLSNGATVVGLEASTGSDTDASIVLTSNGSKPANGTTVTLAGKVYTLKDFVQASGLLQSNEVNLNDGDTVTIGNKTYTFRTALTPTEGEVLIGADADGSLLNLARAINHTGTPDTDYKCAAAHTQVSASGSVTAHAITITALDAGTAGNAIATTETASTRLTFDGATLAGGTDPTVEGEVKIGVSAATMLDNLKAAVNKAAGHGTLYFAAAAHTKVTATTNTDTQQTFVASVGAWSGAAGNGLTGADDSATLSWNQSGIFAGGLDGVLVNDLVASTDLVDTDEAGLVQNLTLVSDAEVITGGNSFILAIRAGSTATTDVKDVDIEYVVL
jgi:hypothetical protein